MTSYVAFSVLFRFFLYKAQDHNKMKVISIFERKPRHSDDQWWAAKKPPVGPASASGNDISVIFSRIISILVFRITNHDGASAVLHSWFYVQSCVSAKYSLCFRCPQNIIQNNISDMLDCFLESSCYLSCFVPLTPSLFSTFTNQCFEFLDLDVNSPEISPFVDSFCHCARNPLLALPSFMLLLRSCEGCELFDVQFTAAFFISTDLVSNQTLFKDKWTFTAHISTLIFLTLTPDSKCLLKKSLQRFTYFNQFPPWGITLWLPKPSPVTVSQITWQLQLWNQREVSNRGQSYLAKYRKNDMI